MIPAPLVPVLEHLHSKPSRTWSLVITAYGDAIVPRGGVVSLGSLLRLFQMLGVAGTVVRQAMWRLAGDGWLQRSRVGRNSFYRLTERGRTVFPGATSRIYGSRAQGWDGTLRLLLPGAGTDRDAARAALDAAGWGTVSPGVWVAAGRAEPPPQAGEAVVLDSVPDGASGRHLAWQAWPLARTAEAYRHFLAVFQPLQDWIAGGQALSDADATAARILLIHEYRRVVLRDPALPDALLPPDWPGKEARTLVAGLYHALLPPSERWLDGNAVAEAGPLPPAGAELWRRFLDPGATA